jgi:predicted DNA-binding protein
MLKVVNKYKHEKTSSDIYIGRGSILGNPFTSKDLSKTKAIYQCESVEESITKYKEYLLDKINNKDYDICNVLNIIGKKIMKNEPVNLVCFCSPSRCHGDIIKEIIEEKLTNKKL